MDAVQDAAMPVRWTWRRTVHIQAFKTFSILVLFSAACLLVGNWDEWPEMVRSGNLLDFRTNGNRKFGEFSANGEKYQQVSSLFRGSDMGGQAVLGGQTGASQKRVAVKFPKVAEGGAGVTIGVAGHTGGALRVSPNLEAGVPANVLDETSLGMHSGPKSSASCVRDADGSDICYYGGVVCYDESRAKLVLIDDERKGERFASTILFQDGRWTLGRLPPESTWPLPINNKIEGLWEGTEALTNATWVDGGLWIVRPETDTTNHIWHNGLAFTGLLQAQMRNASGAFPPQDYVLVLNRTAKMGGYTDYNLGMLKIVTQPQTKLLFPEDLPQNHRLLCANQGGITSYKPSWSTGPLDAAELRARAYEHLKISMVDRANGTQVTVVNRPPGYPRNVENLNQLVAVLKKLGLEVNLVQETAGRKARSFKEQVLTMSQTGIFIAPHGGGLANLAWLPENAVVIELFPIKCVQTEYRNMAAARNLVYFGVEAVNYTHPQAVVDFSPQEVARRQGLSSIDHSHDGTCNQLRKNYPFKVPLTELEGTVRYALEHFFTVPVPFPLQKRL